MSEDRPLTAFTNQGSEPEADDTERSAEPVHDEPTTADDETAEKVTPATATYRWRPGGATCARCGETTERQWRDADVFVCAGCKTW